jgi:hypothetical protein
MSKENEQLEDKTLRQDEVSNDMTRNILKRNGVEVDTQEVIEDSGEKEVDKVDTEPAKVIDDKQEETDTEVTLTEDDIVALEEAGIDEESLDGKTIAEVKAIAQDASKKQVVKDDTPQGQPSVTIEDATKVGGFAGNLVGKTNAELLEIINNQNSHIGTLSAKKSEKEVDSLNQQKIQTEDADKDTEQEAVDLLSLPAEEQAKHLAKIIKQQVDAGIKKGLEESPDLQSAKEVAHKNNILKFHTALGKALPEDVSTPEQAQKVFNDWTASVRGTRYTDDELSALAQTPNVLITLISNDYMLNNKVTPEVKDNNTNEEVKKKKSESYQRMRSMIKSAPSGESKFNFKRKASEDTDSDLLSKDGTDSQQMIGRILEKNLRS